MCVCVCLCVCACVCVCMCVCVCLCVCVLFLIVLFGVPSPVLFPWACAQALERENKELQSLVDGLRERACELRDMVLSRFIIGDLSVEREPFFAKVLAYMSRMDRLNLYRPLSPMQRRVFDDAAARLERHTQQQQQQQQQ